jgi:hypothetical protein
MFNLDEEKDKLAKELAEHYAQNIINMEEYERILEYINKLETKKEISIIENIIQANNVAPNNELTVTQNNEVIIPETKEKHLSFFSWRSSNVTPVNGNGGKYISVFGANRIIVDNLPRGRTVLNVNSIFGLTEIIVSGNIKIINKAVQIFSGIYTPNKINKEDEDLPELYIVGKAIFGNITVKTIDDIKKEEEYYKEYEEKIKEKMLKKLQDKM